MKKLIAVVFTIVMLSQLVCAAYASDLDVQIIGGPNSGSVPLSLDNIQLGETYVLDGYARVIPQAFEFVDFFGQFNDDADYNNLSSNGYYCNDYDRVRRSKDNNFYYLDASWKDSGQNAEFMWLLVDVINLQHEPVNFCKNITIKVIYDEEYEFNGWIRQVNYDYTTTTIFRPQAEKKGANVVVLSPKNEESVDKVYTGTYVIGCTLPNAVVQDQNVPLKVVFTVGDNELTYIIRK